MLNSRFNYPLECDDPEWNSVFWNSVPSITNILICAFFSDNAERLLKESPELFVSPGGPITVSDIDRLRAQMYGST